MHGATPQEDLGERMFFVLGAPRSGTTLLLRMLHAHPDVLARPEPHLLTPLAHLGYYDYVDKASYDPYQAAQSVRAFVADLPRGEDDYLDALRAYANTLYGRMLAPTGKRYFVDKTPAYALVLPFVARLYPRARYVVLTRHPFAIFSSYAKSFFDDDWAAAHEHNPLLERYVPALARFVRESGVPHVHVRYESLVADPEAHLQEICAYAGLAYDPAMIRYGDTELDAKGLGDPIGVHGDVKPNTRSVDKWALDVKGDPARIDILKRSIDRIADEDLATFGYTRESLWTGLEAVDPDAAERARARSRKWDRYHVERRALVALRKNIHRNALGRALRVTRFYSDVLLRDTWSDQVPDENDPKEGGR